MRLVGKNLCVTRPNETYALYKMSQHLPSKRNWISLNLMHSSNDNLLFTSIIRMNSDGLANLENLSVKVVDVKSYALFTHLLIDVKSRSYFQNFY